MKETDASFTSLQDKEQKVCGFLHWLLDAIDLNNTDLQQKATKAPQTQLDHAIQALSCVKKCQMGVSGQADGWNPKNSVIKAQCFAQKGEVVAVQPESSHFLGGHAKECAG